MPNSISDLDVFVQCDERALRAYLVFGVSLLILGVLVVLSSFLPLLNSADPNPTRDLLVKGMGLFTSTVAGLPLNEYLKRRRRLDILRDTDDQWRRLSESENPPEEEIERIKELAWKIREKALAG